MDLNQVLTIVASLVGFPAFLAAVINLLKNFGVIPDGVAPTVNFVANVAVFVAVAAAAIFGKLDLVAQIDATLGGLATFLLAIAAFASSIGLTKLFNAGLRGTPFVGYSYTVEKKKLYD